MIKIERGKTQKENILKSAYQLLMEKGYNLTTTREIADAAQIKRGLLHYYYRQKEDILTDLYADLLSGMLRYLVDVNKIAESGFIYIAIFDLFYYKVISAHQYLNKTIADVLTSHSLKKIKIEKTMALYQKVCSDFKIPISDKDLFLPTAVAIGAESELLLDIMDGELDMSYDELAETIIKLEFLMLRVDDQKIRELIADARQICDKTSVAEFDRYFRDHYPWCQK